MAMLLLQTFFRRKKFSLPCKHAHMRKFRNVEEKCIRTTTTQKKEENEFMLHKFLSADEVKEK